MKRDRERVQYICDVVEDESNDSGFGAATYALAAWIVAVVAIVAWSW